MRYTNRKWSTIVDPRYNSRGSYYVRCMYALCSCPMSIIFGIAQKYVIILVGSTKSTTSQVECCILINIINYVILSWESVKIEQHGN